jgi:hypothetical protein
MPSGFVLPVYKITRDRDNLSMTSTRQGGIAEVTRFYCEEIENFQAKLKHSWERHVDNNAASFTFTTANSSASRGITELYCVEPLLTQSELPSSKFVQLTAAHLDNLARYLCATKTDTTATTFGLTHLANFPLNACYSPSTIEVDLHSDMFRVTFKGRRSSSKTSRAITERYYFSVATMHQTITEGEHTRTNLRPKIKVYWRSTLEHQPVLGRIQVCHLLLAVRNANHLHAILQSSDMLRDRRGFTEIEHITRELDRTAPQELTLLSRSKQQQNKGAARMYLRDVDQAVVKAYRMSRQPIHLMTNAEYHNMYAVSILRQTKAHLTPVQLGGPLAAYTFMELQDGHLRDVSLCEARNTKQARNHARRLQRRMIRSLGVLLAMIVTQCNARR